jgi:hypothetical protein
VVFAAQPRSIRALSLLHHPHQTQTDSSPSVIGFEGFSEQHNNFTMNSKAHHHRWLRSRRSRGYILVPPSFLIPPSVLLQLRFQFPFSPYSIPHYLTLCVLSTLLPSYSSVRSQLSTLSHLFERGTPGQVPQVTHILRYPHRLIDISDQTSHGSSPGPRLFQRP